MSSSKAYVVCLHPNTTCYSPYHRQSKRGPHHFWPLPYSGLKVHKENTHIGPHSLEKIRNLGYLEHF